jgi:glycosyltransferase involved in cell wall biosynthesis
VNHILAATPHKLTIVLLTLNERYNLPPLLEQLVEVILREQLQCEIIISDGGSTDGTLEWLQEWWSRSKLQGRIIVSPRGYGRQLQAACHCSGGERVIYMDGDGQYAPSDIPSMLALLQPNDHQTIISARRKINHNRFYRRIISSIYAALIRYLTGLDQPDLTSGFKCLPGKLARELHISWGLDFLGSTEIMIRAARQKSQIRSFSVCCDRRDHGRSKLLSFSGVKAVLSDLYRLFIQRVK